MQKILKVLFFFLVSCNVIFASWFVLHNDINFSSDIARDFFLLQEVQQKKIVLLGPRSSVMGLFHGPLWTYTTFPGYFIGNGNPVMVGWYWIFLIIIFLIIYYFMVKNLFNELTACIFVLMVSLYTVYHANGLFNPHGAYFLLPVFFFSFIKYLQLHKIRYLLLHIFCAGFIIQFQMAVGIPFTILSFSYLLYFMFRNGFRSHILYMFLLLIPLSSFILFDLKHHFTLLHFAIRQMHQSDPHKTFISYIYNRLEVLSSGTEFLRYGPANGSQYVFYIFVFFLLHQIITNEKYRSIYLFFAYFYIGFFLLSLVNKYDLLYFYIFPLFPLVFLIFSSFVTSKYKNAFLSIFFIIYTINVFGVIHYLQNANDEIIGKSAYSWNALHLIATKVFQGKENDFGYFVYSPDVLAYEPRYAMEYTKKQFMNKKAYTFEKKPITYLVIAPPPKNNPFMQDTWWIQNQIHISATPLSTVTFPNGYKIEKYALNNAEIKIPFDQNSNPGLHFR